MENRLPFIDVLGGPGGRRREDFTSFEYTLPAEITSLYALTPTETLYQIRIIDPTARQRFTFQPGQFVMLELPGIGEAPFSISSSPVRHGDIELCIRRVGNLTNFLARLTRGARVGLSGPFGTHFPVEEMVGQDILLLAGGLGIVPLRSPLSAVLENRSNYGRVDIMYGARNPAELLFTYQYEEWRRFDINLAITVDQAGPGWQGPVGLITEVLKERLGQAGSLATGTCAIVCGPPVMFRFVCDLLTRAGLPPQKMFVSLERRMHCGRGKCCRCNIGSTYTCLDGPVFDYWSVMNLKEAI
ncbi:MAG: oxidoreductase [Deltaproteobacteria bacterium CG_4_10_14_3_um_filter_60_8]|nr:MAG: oxidoreductase [Deltaproteobacteria bacterium CG23_combo_of_CG06-09_8_20_14_all_60_8]PIY21771.1 MAG: oxidoreductase [Deltaproteobacteria bacterium CG_4_10_14_3_um_filter_60_8]